MTKKLYSIIASLALSYSAHAVICIESNDNTTITPPTGIPSGDTFSYTVPGTWLGGWVWTNFTCGAAFYQALLTGTGSVDTNHGTSSGSQYTLRAVTCGTNVTLTAIPGLEYTGTFKLSYNTDTNFSSPTAEIDVEWDYYIDPGTGQFFFVPKLTDWVLKANGGSPCCKAETVTPFRTNSRFAWEMGHSSFPALWESEYPVAMGLEMDNDNSTIRSIHYGHILPNGDLYPVVDAVNENGKFRLMDASHLTNREVDGR